MDVHASLWIITVGIILTMLTVDFVGHVRTPHAPTLKEAGIWSAIYIAIALIFGVVIWQIYGSTYGTEYFAGYLTEKSLSLDNLFVFILIIAAFKVPREDQQKVLLFGIVVALIFRTVFIFLGAALIENFSWVFYIFGAFLIWTAIHQAIPAKEEEEYHENFLIRKLRGSCLSRTPTSVTACLSASMDAPWSPPCLSSWWQSGQRTYSSPSTPFQRFLVSPKNRSSSSPPTHSLSLVCGSCSSSSMASWKSWSTSTTGSLSSWDSLG